MIPEQRLHNLNLGYGYFAAGFEKGIKALAKEENGIFSYLRLDN